MLRLLLIDMHRAFPGKSNFRNLVSSFFLDPGFKCVALYRVQQKLTIKHPRLSMLISSYNLRQTGAQFCVGASVGQGLIVRHPAGIVIGGGVVIGENCILSQGVTIGQKVVSSRAVNVYPRLGNQVLVGANAIILGNINIGDDVTIGAMTLVKSDLDNGVTVVGNPSRVIKKLEI
jgi:serine O-acetyltransferase